MGTLPLESWAVIAAIIGTAVFSTLYVLASILRDATRRVELYKRVAELRAEYARQAALLEERRNGIPRFVDEAGFAQPPVRHAA